MDYVENELDRTGIHLYDRHLQSIGLDPIEPGHERWYEGDDLYLRARRPAEPSVELLKVYRQHAGRRMDRVALTSLSARIKRHQWTGETS
jgi:hypothetical protein